VQQQHYQQQLLCLLQLLLLHWLPYRQQLLVRLHLQHLPLLLLLLLPVYCRLAS
jgi:hypothetical protein